eukprot:449642-Pleurochrysis_carterae.AAC.1
MTLQSWRHLMRTSKAKVDAVDISGSNMITLYCLRRCCTGILCICVHSKIIRLQYTVSQYCIIVQDCEAHITAMLKFYVYCDSTVL